MVSSSPQLHGLPDSPSAQGPLDSLWMTPTMGQRMRFDFARSVIELTKKTEQKKRAAEEERAQKAQKAASAERPAPPVPPVPPEPPPLRFLRY